MKGMMGVFAAALAAVVIFYFMLLGIPSFKTLPQTDSLIREAEANYVAGEKATTVAERKQAFNQAFNDFSQLNRKFHPELGNGKLYFDLANTSYQLEEYPWAVYYYYKALMLMPRNEDAQNNLALALQKLGLPQPSESSLLHRVLPFHWNLSLPERLEFFFFFGILALALMSLWIWMPRSWIKFATVLATLASMLFFFSTLYSRYMAPQEGVLVHAAVLYRDAGEQYAKVTDKPFPAGLKVQVLDVREQGKWLKVLMPDGSLGYVNFESISLL